jgi:hypothetical protein
LIFPPVTGTTANRSQALYDRVIDQLAVENNPRYLPANGSTYCNIFVWDVTRAMNCAIPPWILADGTIAEPGQAEAFQIDIDEGACWMVNYGVPTHGWQLADMATAQTLANRSWPSGPILRAMVIQQSCAQASSLAEGQLLPRLGARTLTTAT